MAVATGKKSIRVVEERSRLNKEVTLEPKDTADDVVRKAGLSPADYAVMKPDGESRFNSGDAVWEHVEENDKLHLVPISSVGVGIVEFLDSVFKGGAGNRSSSFAEVNGWKHVGSSLRGARYEGYFRAKGYRWRGEALRKIDGFVDMFIWSPPMSAVRASRFSACFHPTGTSGKWLVNVNDGNTHIKTKDLNAGVAAVNEMLHEIFVPRHVA